MPSEVHGRAMTGPFLPTPVGWRRVDWETHCLLKEAREEHEQLWAASHPPVTIDQVLLYAAGMNGHDSTLRAMGGALGYAVRDRESVDECEIILGALAD